MKNFAIVIFSCDKNEEVYPICLKLLDKYYPNHPRVYVLSETKYFKGAFSITCNKPLNEWSKRIRYSLSEIPYEKVLFMCDDVFLRAPVNTEKLKEASRIIKDNVANINFENSFSDEDKDCEYAGFKFRPVGSRFRVSLLCGLWNKEKLMQVLSENCSPWDIEARQKDYGFDYYINTDKPIFEWLNDHIYGNGAIRNGRWQKEVVEFLKSEQIEVDYNKKGFYE